MNGTSTERLSVWSDIWHAFFFESSRKKLYKRAFLETSTGEQIYGAALVLSYCVCIWIYTHFFIAKANFYQLLGIGSGITLYQGLSFFWLRAKIESLLGRVKNTRYFQGCVPDDSNDRRSRFAMFASQLQGLGIRPTQVSALIDVCESRILMEDQTTQIIKKKFYFVGAIIAPLPLVVFRNDERLVLTLALIYIMTLLTYWMLRRSIQTRPEKLRELKYFMALYATAPSDDTPKT